MCQIRATNNFVILNTNQIKLYTYPYFLKENNLNLIRKFFSSEATAHFLKGLSLLPHTYATFLNNDVCCNSHY